VLSLTTPVPRLFRGLEALRTPDVIMMLLGFMYRYVSVISDQLRSLRNALDSRGFALSRYRRIRLLGHLAGSLFVRAYDRGERVHAAMLARGWTGGMPSAEPLRLGPSDFVAFAIALLAFAALVVY
jgi:cobalt/nickel transport system permease protein